MLLRSRSLGWDWGCLLRLLGSPHDLKSVHHPIYTLYITLALFKFVPRAGAFPIGWALTIHYLVYLVIICSVVPSAVQAIRSVQFGYYPEPDDGNNHPKNLWRTVARNIPY
jgi:hypothetical protein